MLQKKVTRRILLFGIILLGCTLAHGQMTTDSRSAKQAQILKGTPQINQIKISEKVQTNISARAQTVTGTDVRLSQNNLVRTTRGQQVVITEESFESDFPSPRWEPFWITGARGYTWWQDSYQSNSGSYSVWCVGGNSTEEVKLHSASDNYPNNVDAWFVFGPFNLHDASSAQSSFYYWKELADQNDYFSYGFSVDGYNFSMNKEVFLSSNGWQQQYFDLQGALGYYQVWFGFHFVSDASGTAKGVFIDDVSLTKIVNGTPEVEIFYDEGFADKSFHWVPGARMAMHFTSPTKSKAMGLRYYFTAFSSYFTPGIFKWTGSAPGNLIWQNQNTLISTEGWNSIDLSSANVYVDNDFVVSCGLQDNVLELGTYSFDSQRAWDYDGNSWSPYNETYLIQAIVLPNLPPYSPELISLEDYSTDQAVSVSLQWQSSDPEGGSLLFDVYLDQNNPPQTKVVSRQSADSFLASNLDYDRIYYWRVVAWDTPGDSAVSQIGQFSTTTASFTHLTYQILGGSSQNSYRMISVPGVLTNSAPQILEQSLGAYDPMKWRFFQDKNNLTEYPNTDSLSLGKAFWLISKDSKSMDYGAGRYQTVLADFRLPLVAGWNQVGNPFNLDLNWATIKAANPTLMIQGPYFYSGSYEMRNDFHPFEGCYIHVDAAQTLLLPKLISSNPAQNVVEKTTDSFFTQVKWYLQILASCQNARDEINFLGMSHAADDGFDPNDYLEPPPIGDYISLYFPHQQWQKFTGDYTADFRAVNSLGATWDFEVFSTIRHENVNLSFANIAALPAGWQAVLYDQDNQIMVNLNKTSNYQFQSGTATEKRHFKISVGAADFIDTNQNDFAALPAVYRLYPNYPNPFNSATTIRYDLPTSSQVVIRIFNLQGRLVTTLIDDYQKEGRYQRQWDAGQIGSGIYFLQLQTQTFSQVNKIIILK